MNALKLPKALTDSLRDAAGFSADAFVEAHEKPVAVTSIRLNPAKVDTRGRPFKVMGLPGENDITQPVPWCATGYYLPARPSFTFDPQFHAGCYYVQEASSMFIEQAVKTIFPHHDSAPLRVLDLCAAPGGKSTHLATLFPAGLVVANEVIKTRAGILAENITKWGTGNVIVTSADSSDFTQLTGFFDLVVVDAPCSGSGMFRKDPDAIAEWSPENVIHCSRRQQRILDDIWPCLKENGLLLYSTCSYATEENEQVCDWLGGRFPVAGVDMSLPADWHIVKSESPVHHFHGYRFYPDKVQGEGFFMCGLIKKTPEMLPDLKPKKLNYLPKTRTAFLTQYLSPSDPNAYLQAGEEIVLFPETWLEALSMLSALIYVKKAGIRIGKEIRSELIPDHELAVSTLSINQFPPLPLTYEQAIQYLRRQDIDIHPSFKGWCLMTYEDFRLGWAKLLPSRLNNYYPQSLRILKH